MLCAVSGNVLEELCNGMEKGRMKDLKFKRLK